MTESPSLPTEQVAIDIRKIEAELTEIWRSAAGDTGDERHNAVTRACVLNLMTLTVGGFAAVQQVTEVIDRLTNQYPSRALVVNLGEAGKLAADAPLLDAWVQAHCRMPIPGQPQVCCEQVTISARPEAAARVPGILLPLLIPGLPVVLWAPHGNWLGRPLFARLRDMADRVVVDTATFDDPEAGLVRIAAVARAHNVIADLTWGRLTAWRELLAQIFDAPAYVPHLSEVRRVSISYTHSRVSALLLVGWLADRLGWLPRTTSGETLVLAADSGDITVTISHVDTPTDEDLTSVEIGCRSARFGVALGERVHRVVIRADVTGATPLQHTARLTAPDQVELLSQELRLLGRDETYGAALQLAAALVDPL